MAQVIPPTEDPVVEEVTAEWLTNHQRAIKDAASMATRQVRQASVFTTDALSLLAIGGNATARIRIQQAIAKLQAAITYLPE